MFSLNYKAKRPQKDIQEASETVTKHLPYDTEACLFIPPRKKPFAPLQQLGLVEFSTYPKKKRKEKPITKP